MLIRNAKISLYSIIFFIIFFILNSLILFLNQFIFDSKNITKILSYQSRVGYVSEPSSYLFLIILIACLISYFFIKPVIKIFNKFSIIRVNIILAPLAVVTVEYFSRILLNKNNFPNFEFKSLFNNSFNSISFMFFYWIVISFFACLLYFDLNKLNNESIRFISFIIPLYSYSILILSGYIFESTYLKVVLSFIFILITIYQLDLKKKNTLKIIFSILLIFTSFFTPMYINRPFNLYTWRVDFILVPLEDQRYISLIFLLSIFASIFSVIYIYNKKFKFPTILAGAFFILLSFPINKAEIALLDNFHYGERIGLWFQTISQNLIPYKEIEYPRGILANLIPASFGNFLTPGYPETYGYWYYFLYLFIIIYFALVSKPFVNYYYILLICFFMPFPNGLNEIDYIGFLFVLTLIYTIKYHNNFHLLLLSITFFTFSSILLFPGQGIIISILLILIFLINLFNKAIKYNIKLFHLILYLILCFFIIFNYEKTLFAIKWVQYYAPINQLLFGDNWFNYITNLDNFPLNLRWLIIYIFPFIVYFFLYKFKLLTNFEKILLIFIIFYLVLISGRWLGRVDLNNNSLSRIGFGVIALSIFILIPFSLYLLKKYIIFKYIYIYSLIIIVVFNPLLKSIDYFSRDIILGEKFPIDNFSLQNNDYTSRANIYFELHNNLKNLNKYNSPILNVSGGSALDLYLNLYSIGGIQSPYMIVNETQETRWLHRIVKSNPKIIIGNYGNANLGGLNADNSIFSNRSPKVFNFLMDNYVPVKCNFYMLGIRKDSIKKIQNSNYLKNCTFPMNSIELINYWEEFNGTLPDKLDLGISIYNWELVDKKRVFSISSDKLYLRDMSDKNYLSALLVCPSSGLRTFNLNGKVRGTEDFISRNFNSHTYDRGIITIPLNLFVITHFLEDIYISINDKSCYFKY